MQCQISACVAQFSHELSNQGLILFTDLEAIG